MHNKKIKIITAIGIFIILGIVYFFLWNTPENSVTFVLDMEETAMLEDGSGSEEPAFEEASSKEAVLENTMLEEATGLKGTETAEPPDIYVYVCGHVNAPGVYVLKQGARMYEAVELAGGVSTDGCADYLPMAMTVSDGDRVYIPSGEEAKDMTYTDVSGGSQSDGGTTGKIDLNKASKEQLMTLPGIGEAKADAIVAYRKEHGNFTCIEDVMKISGIKEAAYSKMKDYICVSF